MNAEKLEEEVKNHIKAMAKGKSWECAWEDICDAFASYYDVPSVVDCDTLAVDFDKKEIYIKRGCHD